MGLPRPVTVPLALALTLALALALAGTARHIVDSCSDTSLTRSDLGDQANPWLLGPVGDDPKL